ncbi:unnamed protein product, partial [Staurois parvus]
SDALQHVLTTLSFYVAVALSCFDFVIIPLTVDRGIFYGLIAQVATYHDNLSQYHT